jgi:hypothetical protein
MSPPLGAAFRDREEFYGFWPVKLFTITAMGGRLRER